MSWQRTRHSHRGKQDPTEKAKQLADLELLQWAVAAGEIDLFELDESGFSLWLSVESSYCFIGAQQRLEQTSRQGKQISLLGLLQPGVSFVYGLVVGSFDRDRYITMMTEQAQPAKLRLEQSSRMRVIVPDHSPVHTSNAVKAKWAVWEACGLDCFFLPQYCAELNPIETEWHQLKPHELRGHLFEHELDLADAVMDGIDARTQASGYQADRFRFPSKLAHS